MKVNNSNWIVYRKIDSTRTASFITGVSIDKNNNNIWIGTNGSGIVRFDGNNLWKNYKREIAAYIEGRVIYEINDTSLMSLAISTVEVDKSGNVWAGFIPTKQKEVIFNGIGYIEEALRGGIERYRLSNNRWEIIDFGLSDKKIRDFHIDANNIVWISTIDGLVKYTSSHDIKIFRGDNSGLPSSDITASYLDKNNILWIATKHHGFVKYKGEQKNY